MDKIETHGQVNTGGIDAGLYFLPYESLPVVSLTFPLIALITIPSDLHRILVEEINKTLREIYNSLNHCTRIAIRDNL